MISPQDEEGDGDGRHEHHNGPCGFRRCTPDECHGGASLRPEKKHPSTNCDGSRPGYPGAPQAASRLRALPGLTRTGSSRLRMAARATEPSFPPEPSGGTDLFFGDVESQ